MRNIKLYLSKTKGFNPVLKFRYGYGLGDFIAATLHSKFIGPITYLITGNLEPCQTCSNRRMALNILIPIPFWRIFFKTHDDLETSLNADYKKHGIILHKEGEEPKSDNEPIVEPPMKVETITTMEELIKKPYYNL